MSINISCCVPFGGVGVTVGLITSTLGLLTLSLKFKPIPIATKATPDTKATSIHFTITNNTPVVHLFMLPLTVVISYLLSLTTLIDFLPQLIALLAILTILSFKHKVSPIYLISFIINLIIFSTNGLNSPFFFLVYFLLFVVAFRYRPRQSLILTLTIILFLSQSLNSYFSVIPLLSLLFITPLVWFVSRQSQTIAIEETDFLLWLNLKFKTGITTIIDLSSQLQSSSLPYSQKESLKKIRTSAKNLLNSSEKLTKEISDDE